LRHRFDEGDLDALPVQRTQQPQARPGQGGMIGDRRDEQAAGHAALLTRANFTDELPEFSTRTKPATPA
jgi:hypothetical protein